MYVLYITSYTQCSSGIGTVPSKIQHSETSAYSTVLFGTVTK